MKFVRILYVILIVTTSRVVDSFTATSPCIFTFFDTMELLRSAARICCQLRMRQFEQFAEGGFVMNTEHKSLFRSLFSLFLSLSLVFSLFIAVALPAVAASDYWDDDEIEVEEDGSYTSKEEVALYLHTYGKLPGNFITKKEAKALGWQSSKGNLDKVAPGKSIGGDHFGNYDKLLPEKKGRSYKECDINFNGSYRGAERIIYSDDGLIFYTNDHYQTFEQLY